MVRAVPQLGVLVLPERRDADARVAAALLLRARLRAARLPHRHRHHGGDGDPRAAEPAAPREVPA